MIWMILLGCASTDVAKDRVEVQSGVVVECLDGERPEACYEAASSYPNHADVGLFLSNSCRARLKDSCRKFHRFAQDAGLKMEERHAMLFGCDGGDDTLCEELLKAADVTDNEKDRVFFREFVAKRRSTEGSE